MGQSTLHSAAGTVSANHAKCGVSVLPGRQSPSGVRKPLRISAPLAARLVARLIAAKTGLTEAQIFARTRGTLEVARARQVAMYLMHTSLSLPYVEVAQALERDRTTVSHACKQIEDQRDDGALNAMLCEMEGILELIGPLAGFHWSQRR